MNNVLAVIPAYNEEECLEQTVEELKRIAPQIDFVVVNDGSTDGTAAICKRKGYPTITMPVNGGLTLGFRTGMKYALAKDYDAVVQFDADGQHLPQSIEAMVDVMRQANADIVIGSRFLDTPKDLSARMIGSRLISFIIKVTTGRQIMDPTSGLRLYNRSMIRCFARDKRLNPEPESIAYLIRKGAAVREVQVEMRERQAGESYLSFSKSIAYMARACTSILFAQWFRK